MKVIAITGSMGSGKSEVLRVLRKKGFCTIEADQLARSFLFPKSPCFNELRSLFKNLVPSKKDGFCSKEIAREVFLTNPWKLKRLEDILHPLVQEKLSALLSEKQAQKEPFVFYEIPLLRKKSLLKNRFDFVVLIVRPRAKALKSLIKKGWSEEAVKARLEQQTQESVFEKPDFILQNQGSLKTLFSQLEPVLKSLKAGNS